MFTLAKAFAKILVWLAPLSGKALLFLIGMWLCWRTLHLRSFADHFQVLPKASRVRQPDALVVLIHGLSSTHAQTSALADRVLDVHGFRVTQMNYPSRHGVSLHDSAVRIVDMATMLVRARVGHPKVRLPHGQTGFEKVAFVGISLGGLLARHAAAIWMERYPTATPLIITIASPNAGMPLVKHVPRTLLQAFRGLLACETHPDVEHPVPDCDRVSIIAKSAFSGPYSIVHGPDDGLVPLSSQVQPGGGHPTYTVPTHHAGVSVHSDTLHHVTHELGQWYKRHTEARQYNNA